MLTARERSVYSRVFLLATIYNACWGIAVVLFPRAPFRWMGIEIGQGATAELAMQFWQCIGMFVGVFAIGYYYASRDPERYAPFILIGCLGKILGPTGFAYGWYRGTMPAVAGWFNVTNDLIWLPFFVPFVWKTLIRNT